MQRTPIDPVIPTDQDAVLAANARPVIDAGQNITMRDLPPVVTLLLMDILKETAVGNAVTLVPVEAEITTREAAGLLNLPRPFLVGLIEKGALPARMVGKHRCLPLRDGLAYKASQSPKESRRLTRSSRSIRNSASYERNGCHHSIS